MILCRHYRGRGCFESMGAGLPMEIGDIAFKVWSVSLSVSEHRVVIDVSLLDAWPQVAAC